VSIVEEGGPAFEPRLIKWAGYALVIAGVAAGVAALLVATELMAAIAIGLAAASIAIVLRAPELFEVAGRRRSRGLNPLFVGPAAAVFLGGVENHFIGVGPLGVAALIGAAAAGAVGAARMSRPGVSGRVQLVSLLALIGGLFVYGSGGLIDVRFDVSPAQPIRTTISAMYISHGKSTSYHLTLPPWGPLTEPNSVAISSSLYNQLSPGDPVCINLHRGALQVAWFVVDACPAST
jgi:hypothetical protein